MLTELRTQMKLIMWILVVAFLGTIVFSWGMGGFKDEEKTGIVGELDGEEIKFEEFQRAVQQQIETEKRNAGGELGEDEISKIRESAWDEYVENLLMAKDAERLGIEVYDREIAHIIENFPPPEVQNADMFKREGQFDLTAYQNFLRTPDAHDFLIQMEASVEAFLKQQKLNFHVAQAASITETEVRDDYIKGRMLALLKFIHIPFDDFEVDSSEITEEMMRKYYKQFPGRFTQYPQRRFAYVKFDLAPTAVDTADVFTLAEELMVDIRGGAEFKTLAEDFSEDKGSAQKGGDLGWFGKGKMVEAFEEAAFNAEIGELVGPVESQFGVHIIQVDDKRVNDDGEEEIKAKHILLKFDASADTRDDIYTQAYNFAQEAQERSFDEVVDEMEFAVDTTREFSMAGYIAGLGRMRMAATFCFKTEEGTISNVFSYPQGYVVFKNLGGTEEGTKSFEDVENTIFKTLKKLVEKQKAWDATAEILANISTPYDMESAAESAGYEVHETDSLKVTDTLPGGLPADADFTLKAFRLDVGEISGIIEGKKAFYIAYMVDKSPIDEELYLAMHEDIYQKLLRQKQNALQRNWIRELRIAADIEDYRYQYFRDF